LLEVHVNPFLFVPRETYFSAAQELKAGIKDSIEIKSFLLHLYQLTALLKDGHCTPSIGQPVFKDDLSREIFFPYHLVLDGNNLYVPKTMSQLSGIPTGAIILSINGKTTQSLLMKIQNTMGGNAEHCIDMQEKLLGYFFYLSNVQAPFVIQYEDAEGQVSEKQIEKGAKFIDALSATMPHLKTKYRFQIVDNKLGYLDFMNMSDLSTFDKYLDSCVTLLKTKNITNLAIDLRRNGGGNSVLGDLLISYFNSKNYTLMGGRNWKISAQYKQLILSNGDSTNQYLKKKDGSVWKLGSCKPNPPRFKNDNLFSGKVYLLIGPFTFSSANMLADGAKEFRLAEIIGEPTGENTNDFGEVYTFALPNSKIKIQTTTSFDFGASCNKNLYSPVMPDKPVPRSRTDRIEENDKALAYILETIN